MDTTYALNARFSVYAGTGVGRHEGDWEVAVVLLTRTGKPLLAAYSEHSCGKRRAWRRVPALRSTASSFGSRSADAIHNQVRGLHPWPHAFSFVGGRRLILLRTSPEPVATST